MPLWNPEEEGKTHLNIYSQSRLSLGRWMSNWTNDPIDLEGTGKFLSIEGLWYYLTREGTEEEQEKLRYLTGFAAKEFGRKLPHSDLFSPNDKHFQQVIHAAIRQRLDNSPEYANVLRFSTVPLTHYYVFNGVVREGSYQWVVDLWKEERQRLQQTNLQLLTRSHLSKTREQATNIDVTIKSAVSSIGKAFAPTWEIVMGHKEHRITDEEYTEQYLAILSKISRQTIFDLANTNLLNINFQCYCNDEQFCHTYLLIDWLVANYPHLFTKG